MSKFPSISQYRNVVGTVSARARYVGKDAQDNALFDNNILLPVVEAIGTVKVHGTNAGVTLTTEGNLECWSRTRVISPLSDNKGFASFVKDNEDTFKSLLANVTNTDRPIIYGEWCGKGINKGCAIHKLDRMFVIFAVRDLNNQAWINPDYWNIPNNLASIHDIHKFGVYNTTIDFNYPEGCQNTLVSLTNTVEEECPVGKYFGVSGIGEGIVWRLSGKDYNDSDFWFKVKGEKHSVTKTKNLAEVDVQKLAQAEEFAKVTVTEERCLQGVDLLEDVSIKSTGLFLSWIVRDILKEESDRLAETLTPKDVHKQISNTAKNWFFNYLNNNWSLNK